MSTRPHTNTPGRLARLLVLAILAGSLLLVGTGVAGSGSVSGQQRWMMRDLGTWLGGKQSWATAINERGQVVVVSETAQRATRAFLWENGSMRALGAGLGGPGSWASAISARGHVVGQADTKAIAKSGHHVTHAVLWKNGKVTDLGVLARGESSYATAANEHGQVAGSSCRNTKGAPDCRAFVWQNGALTDLGAGRYGEVDINERGQVSATRETGALGTNHSPIRHAFLWQNGNLTDLGTLGGPGSAVAAINDRGQVVGQASTTAKSKSGYMKGMPITHAFLWQSGKMRDLGALGGEFSYARAINERGQVVGVASTKTGAHPFLWSDGRMRDLGSLGGPSGEARAVNAHGQVVGWAATARTDRNGEHVWHAFVWQNGSLTDLGTLGGRSQAVAISDRGWIIGWSETRDGAVHAVLWTAVAGE